MPNRDDVIKMAREAGYGTQINSGDGGFTFSTELWGGPLETEKLTRFAQLVAAQAAAEEREACASHAENFDLGTPEGHAIASAIRARGTA